MECDEENPLSHKLQNPFSNPFWDAMSSSVKSNAVQIQNPHTHTSGQTDNEEWYNIVDTFKLQYTEQAEHAEQ